MSRYMDYALIHSNKDDRSSDRNADFRPVGNAERSTYHIFHISDTRFYSAAERFFSHRLKLNGMMGQILSRNFTHAKAANIIVDLVRKLNAAVEAERSTSSLRLPDDTESIFSYAFPGSGLHAFQRASDSEFYCGHKTRVLCLVKWPRCRLNAMTSAVDKHIPQMSRTPFGPEQFDFEIIDRVSRYPLPGGSQVYDPVDEWRTAYYLRKLPRPMPLNWLATEGTVDDLFGSWLPRDENPKGNYDACADQNLYSDSNKSIAMSTAGVTSGKDLPRCDRITVLYGLLQ
jgi:hypothetical protein